jgi:hypothetical protein
VSRIEDAARRLVAVFDARDLESTADAMRYLTQVVRETDAMHERIVKRPATLADGLLNLDDTGGL